MENSSRNVKNKNYLMLCELHYPDLHGKTETSDPNIETHYLVYERFDPETGISFCDLDEYDLDEYDLNEYDFDEYDLDEYGDLDTDEEYETVFNFPSSYYTNNLSRMNRINDKIDLLKMVYSNLSNFNSTHPTIRNYMNIIRNPNYIKPEIGEYIILPTQEAIAILKTFWLRIIQKKWKKVFQHRKNIIRQRCYLSNLLIKEIRGRWPETCFNLPGLRGMLSKLKSN